MKRERFQPLTTCFITRYQHDKLYVDIAIEVVTDLRRHRSCRHPCRDYFDDIDILTLLAERIYYLYLLPIRQIYDNVKYPTRYVSINHCPTRHVT
jgi:hypothetical protein